MSRTNPRQGLFHGYWYTLEGKKIRRIYRSEYADLYRLHSKHADIRESSSPVRMGRRQTAAQLGVTPLGRMPELTKPVPAVEAGLVSSGAHPAGASQPEQ